MPQSHNNAITYVNVTIAGRAYRMACESGDEARIEALAARVDARINELAASFGSIDELRLTVMAAFSMADDLANAERKIAAYEDDIEKIKEQASMQEAQALRTIEAAIERIEHITSELTPVSQA